MDVFGSSSGPVIKGSSSSSAECRDFLCVCVVEGGGGSASVRTTQFQNNGHISQQFWSCHQGLFKQLL